MALQSTDLSDAAATGQVYRLLSRIWLREVDVALLQLLENAEVSDAFALAGGVLPTANGNLDDLAVEYCRLFVGPSNHLPPYQSVWRSGQFQGEAVASMNEIIDLTGYESNSLMVDHLGVQLDVAANILSHVECGAAASDQVPRELMAYFVRKHLTWSFGLLEAAAHRVNSNFYRSLLQLTRNFLASEWRYWRSIT